MTTIYNLIQVQLLENWLQHIKYTNSAWLRLSTVCFHYAYHARAHIANKLNKTRETGMKKLIHEPNLTTLALYKRLA